MSAPPRPARVWPFGGSAPPGAWPAPRSTPCTSASTPSSRRQSVGDRSPISDQALPWRSKPTWRHRPGRARATARSGLGFGSVAIRVASAGAPPDARERSRPIAAAAVAAIPMTVMSSLMPPMAFGCSRWTTAGAFTAVEHWNAESIGRHVCNARATASPPCSRCCRAVWLDRGRRGSWPCGWITAPSICRTNQPDQVKLRFGFQNNQELAGSPPQCACAGPCLQSKETHYI